MTESVETRIAYALETTLNVLVYRDGFGTEDIVAGLLAVARQAAATGMSLQDLRDCVEDMMDEAALDHAPEEEDAE
jgi:hypothetical protein